VTAGSIWSGDCASNSKRLCRRGQPFKVAQVKEKFGGLRFYFEGGNDAFHAIRACIAAAAQESFHICEVCGQPGYLIGHNRTRCDEHFHSGSRHEWDERYQKLLKTDAWARAGATARRSPSRNAYNAVTTAAIDFIQQSRSELGRPETSVVRSASQGTRPDPASARCASRI
jgi:hypothetical protein